MIAFRPAHADDLAQANVSLRAALVMASAALSPAQLLFVRARRQRRRRPE